MHRDTLDGLLQTDELSTAATFRCRKRAMESLERRMEVLRCGQQSVMALPRYSTVRRRSLATIASLCIFFIGCWLLAAIVSPVQAEERPSPSVVSVNYYKAVESDENGVGFKNANGASNELNRSLSIANSGGDSVISSVRKFIGLDHSVTESDGDAKVPRTVAAPQRLISSENVILPKFGDRISPRKQHHSAQQSDYYGDASAKMAYDHFSGGGGSVNAREARGGLASVISTSASIVTNPVHSKYYIKPVISDSAASSNSGTILPRKDATVMGMNATVKFSDEDQRSNEIDGNLPILLNENQVHNQNVSSAQAHRLEMSTEFFVIPPVSTPLPLKTKSTTRRPNGGMLVLAKDGRKPIVTTSQGAMSPPTIIATSAPMSGLRKEPWVVPVLVLATLSMFMMAAFEVFVLCKAWRTSPSRRHLFLGQMLLLGLFSCAGLAAILTVTPTLLSCATIRFGAGVAFALVFASLLVKCVFLISLNGGVYLPAPYQGLLLLFAVLIQIAVGSQWLLTKPPAVDTLTDYPTSHSIMVNRNVTSLYNNNHNTTNPLAGSGFAAIALCRTQFSELLLSLIYVAFLMLFVAILAIKSRAIRDNYREATYIGLAIGGSIPIWLGWTLCGLAVAERHRDACLAFGLIATSMTVFLVMFMPKGRQLAAMGKEGLYVEDREERFSSLSRAGSGYSPSFFHFKPIKYGMMGGANSPSNTGIGLSNNLTNCNTNNNSSTNNGNNSSMPKHQAVATLGGDRVALVPNPGYTRMYYPAHLTHPLCYYYPATAPTAAPAYFTAAAHFPPPSTHSPPTSFYPTIFPHSYLMQHPNGSGSHMIRARYVGSSGLFMRPDDANLYTTLEQPTLSSNPNVYFQRGGGLVHPGMMY